MDLLSISSTTSSPEVQFDPVTGALRMSGESYPENTFEFYSPVLNWVKNYLSETTIPVSLTLELAYLNTGSVKCLMDLFDLLEDAFVDGRTVQIVWRYHAKNTRALETAEEFSEDLTLPFLIEVIE